MNERWRADTLQPNIFQRKPMGCIVNFKSGTCKQDLRNSHPVLVRRCGKVREILA
jgi:hypothetical protein